MTLCEVCTRESPEVCEVCTRATPGRMTPENRVRALAWGVATAPRGSVRENELVYSLRLAILDVQGALPTDAAIEQAHHDVRQREVAISQDPLCKWVGSSDPECFE